MSTPTTLDHIIVLVPYATLQSLPPWLTENFTITPGGQHADKCTENKLITFNDGVYIELIAFIDDDLALQKGHWWGEKKIGQGVIDWCLSGQLDLRDTKGVGEGDKDTSTTFQFPALLKRVSAVPDSVAFITDADGSEGKVSYAAPRHGARLRPDGEKLEWRVTFPVSVTVGGASRPPGIPFFCHDVTSRELRTSTETAESKERYTRHPCGAIGVSEMTLLVPQKELGNYGSVISAVVGSTTARGSEDVVRIKMSATHNDSADLELVVKAAGTAEEKAHLEKFGVGVYEIVVKSEKVEETSVLEGEGLRIRVVPL